MIELDPAFRSGLSPDAPFLPPAPPPLPLRAVCQDDAAAWAALLADNPFLAARAERCDWLAATIAELDDAAPGSAAVRRRRRLLQGEREALLAEMVEMVVAAEVAAGRQEAPFTAAPCTGRRPAPEAARPGLADAAALSRRGVPVTVNLAAGRPKPDPFSWPR